MISTDRVARPRHLEPGRVLDADTSRCPFCPGNESHTPPSLLTVNGPDGWRVRAFPNRFPAVGIEGELDARARGPYDVVGGVGAHEVIVETRDHVRPPWHDPRQQALALLAARDRMRDLARDSRFQAILWFRNHGPEAGASLGHPHAQVVALPIVPPRLAHITKRFRRHHQAHGRELMKDVLDFERADRRRVLFDDVQTTTFLAYAPRFAFETWIVPNAPAASFLEATDAMIDEVATAMCRVIVAFDRVLAEPPHNALIVTAPAGSGPGFRWHITLMPRMAAFAGFELLSGASLTGTAPEEAARLMRTKL